MGVSFDPETSSPIFGDEIPLLAGSVKKQFMQGLLKENVHVLVGTGVCGVLADGEQKVASGVVLASKFGLHVAKAKRIVDASLPDSAPTSRQVAYTVEVYGVAKDTDSEIAVPESLGFLGNKVLAAARQAEAGAVFSSNFGSGRPRKRSNTKRACEPRPCLPTCKESQGLRQGHHRSVGLADGGRRTNVSIAARMQTTSNSRAPPPSSCRVETSSTSKPSPESVSTNDQNWQRTPDSSSSSLSPGAFRLANAASNLRTILGRTICWRRSRCQSNVSCRRKLRTDVVVAGGGTAGAMAAMGSVQEGARTITVEYLPDLGGTSTIGRVTGYYWGYKDTRFFENIEEDFKAQGGWPADVPGRWQECFTIASRRRRPAGTLLTGAITCGVVQGWGGKSKACLWRGQGGCLPSRPTSSLMPRGTVDVAAFAGAATKSATTVCNAPRTTASGTSTRAASPGRLVHEP